MFTHCLTMSQTLKPKSVYKQQVIRKSKTMTEQSSTSQSVTKVQSHLPDVQLIERDALWEDLKNRIKINNYECSKAMEDLKSLVEYTKKTYTRLSK